MSQSEFDVTTFTFSSLALCLESHLTVICIKNCSSFCLCTGYNQLTRAADAALRFAAPCGFTQLNILHNEVFIDIHCCTTLLTFSLDTQGDLHFTFWIHHWINHPVLV